VWGQPPAVWGQWGQLDSPTFADVRTFVATARRTLGERIARGARCNRLGAPGRRR
jgi:hypothetical protein